MWLEFGWHSRHCHVSLQVIELQFTKYGGGEREREKRTSSNQSGYGIKTSFQSGFYHILGSMKFNDDEAFLLSPPFIDKRQLFNVDPLFEKDHLPHLNKSGYIKTAFREGISRWGKEEAEEYTEPATHLPVSCSEAELSLLHCQ